MKSVAKRNLTVCVMLAGLPAMILMVAPAQLRAQTRVPGFDGHALDANPQVGSNGYNGPSATVQNQQNINNNIVNRDVTGLNYFHGKISTFDENNLQLNTGSGPSDVLNQISAPVDYTRRTTGTPLYQPYYDQSHFAPVPAAPAANNFVATPGGKGYVPAPVVDPLIPSTDVRLDLNDNNDPLKNNLPTIGELNVVGPADPSGSQSMYSMSPLYGVRQVDNSAIPGSTDTMYQRQANGSLTGPNGTRLTPMQIQQMRNELNSTAQQNANGTTDNSGNTLPANPNQVQSSAVDNAPINQQVTPGNTNAAGPTSPGQAPGAATPGDMSTGQGVQSQLLIPAGKQSKQLKDLEDKYAKLHRPLTDVEATDKLNAEMRARTAANPLEKKPIKPGEKPAPAGTGTEIPLLNKPQPTTKEAYKPILNTPDSTKDNQPYVVTSLATGIEAKGLSDLMKSAEDKMRQGKFTEAVDTYETAYAVAPNNPFVSLGRSFAELGASYYGKADKDLNRAIVADPAVLAGKYDLNGFLGVDRVNFINKDLTDIAAHQHSGRPLVLLGFIAHNNGDDNAAAKYLDQAAPRGGYDSLIALMRSTWGLKTDGK